MNKLKELVALCKFGIHVSVNNHKNSFMGVVEYLHHKTNVHEREVSKRVFQNMVRLDTIVQIDVYLENSISCFTIFHYDIYMAIDEAIMVLKG